MKTRESDAVPNRHSVEPIRAMRESRGAVFGATFTNQLQPLGEPIGRTCSYVSQHIQHLHYCFNFNCNFVHEQKLTIRISKC